MREKMKERVEAKVAEILEKAKGSDIEKDLRELLTLKGQADIVPVELEIPVEEVVRRYPITDAWEIVRCKTCFFFHANSFYVVSKPTLANNGKGGALYEWLEMYCDYVDNKDDFTPDQREYRDILCQLTAQVLSLPLDIFTDMDYCVDVAMYITQKRTELFEKVLKEAEKPVVISPEDAVLNAEFEKVVEEESKRRLS